MSNGDSNAAPVPARPDPSRDQDRYDDYDMPAGGAAGSSSLSPRDVLEFWNSAVPEHMRAASPPRVVPSGDWPAVFEAVARNRFLCGEGRRNGPVSLPWVLANPGQVMAYAVQAPPPRKQAPADPVRFRPCVCGSQVRQDWTGEGWRTEDHYAVSRMPVVAKCEQAGRVELP